MYEAFFGLREKPFSLLPDPRFLYAGRSHRTALGLLEYGLGEQVGFVVLTGEVGSGKTTLVRHLLDGAARDLVVGLVTTTHHAFGELMAWILRAFDLDGRGLDPVGRHELLVRFLIDRFAERLREVNFTALDRLDPELLSVDYFEIMRYNFRSEKEMELVFRLTFISPLETLEVKDSTIVVRSTSTRCPRLVSRRENFQLQKGASQVEYTVILPADNFADVNYFSFDRFEGVISGVTYSVEEFENIRNKNESLNNFAFLVANSSGFLHKFSSDHIFFEQNNSNLYFVEFSHFDAQKTPDDHLVIDIQKNSKYILIEDAAMLVTHAGRKNV